MDRESEETQLAELHEKWVRNTEDLTGEIPLELSPFREVNYNIALKDKNMQHTYGHPHCLKVLQVDLCMKMNKYISAGWWEMKPTLQATPLLCIPKKNNRLYTIIDAQQHAQQQNDNPLKDVTLFLDQDQIKVDMVKAKYQTKIKILDAYEQIIQVNPNDIWRVMPVTC